MTNANLQRRRRRTWFGWAGSSVARLCDDELALIAERRRAAASPATLGIGPAGR